MVLADSRPLLRPERASAPVVKKDPFTGPPKPFAFRYGVADVDSGSNFDHAQKQDSSGVVTGQCHFEVTFQFLFRFFNQFFYHKNSL